MLGEGQEIDAGAFGTPISVSRGGTRGYVKTLFESCYGVGPVWVRCVSGESPVSLLRNLPAGAVKLNRFLPSLDIYACGEVPRTPETVPRPEQES